MTRKSKARYGLKRTYRVNPTVKALRAALMAGLLATASTSALAAPYRDVALEDQQAGDVAIVNVDDLTAVATNIAAGIVGSSLTGDVTVDNSGDIYASALNYGYYPGSAIYAAGIYSLASGEAAVDNSGNIEVVSHNDDSGNTRAWGIFAGDFGGANATYSSIDNTGSIQITATSENGNIDATGLEVLATYDAEVYNTGDISVYAATGGVFASATAIEADATHYTGESWVDNDGDLNVAAYSQYMALATGISAEAGEEAIIINHGALVATATVYAEYSYALAEAVGIHAGSGGDVAITNSGLISVASYVYDEVGAPVASSVAIGIEAYGDSISMNNVGDIDAFASNEAYLGSSVAIGIDAYARNDITIGNTGDIDLAGSSGDGYARTGYYPNYVYVTGDFTGTGIRAESYYGSINVSNTGDITITDLNDGGGIAGGFNTGDRLNGIVAKTLLGDSTISNSGDVTLTGGEVAYGLIATTDQLTVYYTCPPPYDNGYFICYNRYGGGDATVVNSGDIEITVGVDQPYDFNFGAGIVARTGKYGGNAVVQNSGDITVNVTGGPANGIVAGSTGKYSNGNSIVINSGDIVVTSTGFSTAIDARSVNDVYVYNSGDITVSTSNKDERATGIYSLSTYESAFIRNFGDITALGGIGANGAGSAGNYGATTINSGDITVESTYFYTMYNYYTGSVEYLGGWANGLFATSRFGGVATVINRGDIEVNALTEGLGISAFTRYGNAYVYNYGDVTVSGQYVSAYGISLQGSSYEQARSGTLTGSRLDNRGDITVTSEALAVGISARQVFDELDLFNFGDITASIENNDGYGSAFGVIARNTYGDIDILNQGDITVASGGQAAGISASSYGGYFYFYYSGSGSFFYGDVSVISIGDLSVTSDNARATGVFAGSSLGSVLVGVEGSIDVSAYDRAFGIDARSNYGNVQIGIVGDVNVVSTNYNAAGLRALSEYYDATVYNYGDIEVQAAGLAQGIVALSYYGNVGVLNAGDVTASSTGGGYSQAVALRSGTGYNAILQNFGTITAGSGNALAVSITGGDGIILNSGDISGGILTDVGDDYVHNYEGGRIFLTDDTIDLGDGYNYFLNEGRVYADGMNNVIDMGYYGGGEGGYYGLFVNNGTSIHMNDGAADDALTIIGDFAGAGDVNVDVDGSSLTSDMLYIDGNVLAGTENVINVDLLSLPSAAALNAGATIPIVEVSGSSAVTDFVLGDVDVGGSALFTADYSLVYDGSEFALGFDITGLSTAGVLLTSLSPAIQNMWYGSLGTMYQRQGGERVFLKSSGAADVHGAAGAWTRIYGSDGSITPSANRNNFGDAGSQDFSFGNDGLEFGAGYSFTEAWTVGLLGGISKGTFRPDVGGRGELTANTIGGYVTFTPGNGFYADLSYRDFSIDGEVNGAGVYLPVDGDASGYSLELGYGFKTKSGLEIEPQLQYSSMDVSLDDVGYDSGDFKLTDGDSDMFRAGIALRKSYEQYEGVWTPYTALSYVDITSASNSYLIGGVLEGGVDLTGGSVLFELGTDAKYGDLLFNVGVGVQDGGAYEFVYSGQMNIRYTW